MDGLRFEIAKPENKDDLLNYLLEYFMIDEPISRSIHLSKNDAYELFNDLVLEGLADPVSFVCYHESEIVGCRLNMVKEINHDKDHSSDENEKKYNPSAQKIVDFLDVLTKDFPDLMPDAKKIMKFIIVSVHPKYQRRGIAKKLIDLSFEVAAKIGCDHVLTIATATRSQQMFDKLRFETLRVVKHEDFCIDGQRVFNCDDGTSSGKLMVKKL